MFLQSGSRTCMYQLVIDRFSLGCDRVGCRLPQCNSKWSSLRGEKVGCYTGFVKVWV